MASIDPNTLLKFATRFFLGRHVIDHNLSEIVVPVYLERCDNGWSIRAQMGALNPHYLNQQPYDQHLTMKDHTKKYAYTTFWRYKNGTSFANTKDAIDHFNRVVYGDLIQKPSEILLLSNAS